MIKTIAAAVIALVIGLLVGWFLGRNRLEKQWQSPFAGNVLKPMPFGRARKALKEACAHDPVVYTVATFGSDENKTELHVVVENRGKCKVTELTGTAYGFDAWGKPSPVAKDGALHVAFDSKDPIEPGASANVAKSVDGADLATLAIAQIDSTKCADGTTWARK